MNVSSKMKVDPEEDLEADDPSGQRNETNLVVEDVTVTLYGLSVRNGQYQDASKYRDPVCYEDIRLFKEDLVLTDVPFAFDSDFAEMRIDNVIKVTLNRL